MDALKRPLRIPPEFSRYAEDKGLFLLYEKMMEELLVNRPDDPLTFLHNYLSRSKDDVPRVVVYGPPVSGQHTISKLAARKLKAVHLTPKDILHADQTLAGEKARSLAASNQEIPETLWSELFQHRLKESDCINKGWIIEGFPRTREQALAFQSMGIMAHHFVHLEAPDSVLVERYAGKRIDSLTKDVYHTVFAPARSEEVASRLVEEPGGVEQNVRRPLDSYHRDTESLLTCYPKVCKLFNADQPIQDLFDQVLTFLCTRAWTAAPHTPRVVLLGATGSGKSLQAANLARKYNLVEVDFKVLIKQCVASGSKSGSSMRPFIERNMLIPDNIAMPILDKRLSQLDCQKRGFVLHGFPLSRDQAELLAECSHQPNRVFFLNIPEDSIKERLTLRRVDPVTGERFHLLFAPPPSQEISNRLLTHPDFTEEKVMGKVSLYNGSVDELASYYTWAQHINADQDPLTVFECIESALVNPLPKQLPPNMPRLSADISISMSKSASSEAPKMSMSASSETQRKSFY